MFSILKEILGWGLRGARVGGCASTALYLWKQALILPRNKSKLTVACNRRIKPSITTRKNASSSTNLNKPICVDFHAVMMNVWIDYSFVFLISCCIPARWVDHVVHRSVTSSSQGHKSRSPDREKKSKRSRRRSSDSSNDARDDSALAIGRMASISELTDLTARKKAEVERLAELERERMQLLRQKETRENLIQTEVERRVKEIVETRVREELERRKDEIENEVKRRVDVLKRSMEKQMLLELEKRNNDEMRRLIAKEEEERKKREDLERILAENERKLSEAEKRIAEEEEKLRTEQLRLMEDRERFERQLGKQQSKEQNLILGKNKTREKISFSLNSGSLK
ncbi:unnamed protein product [Adineta ricciae]|uniref:Uncharacterized protein n=1 Tax=Adineta ricciae TaxID=249248 RepID=A0A813VWG3_ADIRI|nr:unnamed protein product [Adineta ricciae]